MPEWLRKLICLCSLAPTAKQTIGPSYASRSVVRDFLAFVGFLAFVSCAACFLAFVSCAACFCFSGAVPKASMRSCSSFRLPCALIGDINNTK